MSEKLVVEGLSADSSAHARAHRSFWSSRAPKIACIGFFMALGACMADVGSDDVELEGDETGVVSQAATNLCAGQAANTFFCIDDTAFAHCVGGDRGFEKVCAPGVFCVQQDNPTFNPCVGREPGQGNAGNVNNGNNNAGNNNAGNAGDNNAGNNNNAGNDNNNPPPPPPPPPADNGVIGQFDPGTLPLRDGSVNLRNAFFSKIQQNLDGSQNVGLGIGTQFITGQCFTNADCAGPKTPGENAFTACCARIVINPAEGFVGRCSGIAVQNVNGKQGCGFDVRRGF